ncbi:hypothetical protein BCY88_07620 [Paraburkholderia fungorum]|uniref:Uncharacterized protein n=1 Tax=Paraburkholderia fungorum TaxID=134537 RepID=A0A3R7L8G9_9BURK|nr:hypothetical protein BCY88_07620 [Paraburkholderia fungorum]
MQPRAAGVGPRYLLAPVFACLQIFQKAYRSDVPDFAHVPYVGHVMFVFIECLSQYLQTSLILLLIPALILCAAFFTHEPGLRNDYRDPATRT